MEGKIKGNTYKQMASFNLLTQSKTLYYGLKVKTSKPNVLISRSNFLNYFLKRLLLGNIAASFHNHNWISSNIFPIFPTGHGFSCKSALYPKAQ